jgi:hypothetical protein
MAASATTSIIIPKVTEDVLELYADRVISTNGMERVRYFQEFEVRKREKVRREEWTIPYFAFAVLCVDTNKK